MSAHPSRFVPLNALRPSEGPALYWCEGAPRAEWNLALERAIEHARDFKTHVTVVAIADPGYLPDNKAQLKFLAESWAEFRDALAARGMGLTVLYGPVGKRLRQAAEALKPGLAVFSSPFIRRFEDAQEAFAASAPCACVRAEDNTVVPPDLASVKKEFAARTIRPKVWSAARTLVGESWTPLPYAGEAVVLCEHNGTLAVRTSASAPAPAESDATPVGVSPLVVAPESLLDIPGTRQAARLAPRGGRSAGIKRWQEFLAGGLSRYDAGRQDANADGTSGLSSYLHLGCLSPIEMWHALGRRLLPVAPEPVGTTVAGIPATDADAFLEQLVVRRELAVNFYRRDRACDAPECLPEWAVKTMDAALRPAGAGYTYADLASARTDDPVWNAAQRQLLATGTIHNRVRMYWGKRAISWFADWREAFRVLVRLNDAFAVDGGSPNGYAGVAWCFGLHDRPFPPNKPTLGLVRPMGQGALKKSFDLRAYTAYWLGENEVAEPRHGGQGSLF